MCITNRAARARPLALAAVLAAALPAAVHADSHEAAVPGDHLAGVEAAALDRALVLARRQQDLLTTLAEIGRLLGEVRPLRQPILALLDETLSPDDRWRQAMASLPAPGGAGGDPGIHGQSAEIVQLRAEVESLRAEMALFLQTAPLPGPGITVPDMSPDPLEDGPVETSVPDWEPDRSAVRFVQFAMPGEEDGHDVYGGNTGRPAVWLGDGEESARVEEGGTIRFAGRLVRLAVLRPLADGRISIGLEVDGTPRTILW